MAIAEKSSGVRTSGERPKSDVLAHAIAKLKNPDEIALMQEYQQLCNQHYRNMQFITTMFRVDPTSAARLLLQRNDIAARFAGDALSISTCKL